MTGQNDTGSPADPDTVRDLLDQVLDLDAGVRDLFAHQDSFGDAAQLADPLDLDRGVDDVLGAAGLLDPSDSTLSPGRELDPAPGDQPAGFPEQVLGAPASIGTVEVVAHKIRSVALILRIGAEPRREWTIFVSSPSAKVVALERAALGLRRARTALYRLAGELERRTVSKHDALQVLDEAIETLKEAVPIYLRMAVRMTPGGDVGRLLSIPHELEQLRGRVSRLFDDAPDLAGTDVPTTS